MTGRRLWLLRALASVGTGCLMFLACADFDIWPLAWIGFVPLLVAVRGVRPRRAFLWGWLAGLVANAGGFYWITTLLMRFGHMHWVPALLLFLLLALYQGLHWGLLAYLVRRIHDRSPALPMTLLAPVVMTAMELVMPFVFPWYIAITQAWVIPVIQVAELTGPLGVSFLLMLTSGMVYDLIAARLERRPWPRRPLAVGAAVLAAVLVFGFVRIGQIVDRRAAAPHLKVGVVQGNVGIVEKGRARLAPLHLRMHQEVSKRLQDEGAELIVWPESAYPYYFDRAMTRDWPEGDRRRVMEGFSAPLLFGTITYGKESRYPFNSALMMEPDGRITGRFDKNFLLVFGEYIPFYEHIPQFKDWFPEASNFSRGTEVTTFQLGEYRIAPMICYEDIIPAFGRRLARLDPDLIVNITNDAWFGRTSEPYEHLALAVYRAVELRLDLVRAVNTGVSAVVGPTGRVLKATESVDPVVTPGVPPVGLLGDVAMMPGGGKTLYTWAGDWLGYLCLVGVVGLVVWPRRRRGSGESPGRPATSRPRGRRKRKR